MKQSIALAVNVLRDNETLRRENEVLRAILDEMHAFMDDDQRRRLARLMADVTIDMPSKKR